MRDKDSPKLFIGEKLIRLEKERWHEATDRETAKKIGIHPSTYCELKSDARPATLGHLQLLCAYFRVSIETFIDSAAEFTQQRGDLRWHVRAGLVDEHLITIRTVVESTLEGRSPGEIAVRIARGDGAARKATELAITPMARAGLALGLVDLVLAPGAYEVQDEELADKLAEALSNRTGSLRRVTVKVVKNLAHADFERDPIVPFLIARVAHWLVARFLDEHPLASTIGIAGGIHLGTFVRTIGYASSPFPRLGTRRFNLVPLTLEPFHDHHFELADALVGELHNRAAMLLGGPWVHAPSFKPFGFLEDKKITSLETDSVPRVRELYHQLDVAIYGCGDRSDDGWIEWTQKLLGMDLDAKTDVCLNMIDENAAPIPLPMHDGRPRGYLGAGIDRIRSLSPKKDKLTLLLASGRSKGLPITLVVRAGCANAVICDRAAALAALEVLGGTHGP